MKHKKLYCLIAIVITVVIALLVFVCLNFRIMRVDKVKIADDNVRTWLEEIADKEKAKSNTIIFTYTTRNSIIAQPMAPNFFDVSDTTFGCAIVNGVKFFIKNCKLEETIPVVFEKIGEKTAILKYSSFALSHTIPFFQVERSIEFDNWEEYHFKYVDGKWSTSTWEETFGEEISEEYNKWKSDHPDTLVLTTPIKPSFVERYDSLTENNFNAFFKEWKHWSKQLKSFSTDSLINRSVTRVFTEYKEINTDSCAFCSLPGCIEVRRYPGPFIDYPFDDIWDRTLAWEYMMKASDRFSYVPSLDSDKAVVYVTPEIGNILSHYIGGVYESGESGANDFSKWTKINEDRLTELRYLIQVSRDLDWHFESMPIIISLYLYDDGFVADIRTSWCCGETVFFPNDLKKKKKSLSDWII